MHKINWPKFDSDHLMVYSKQMLEIEKDIFSKGMPEEALMEKVGIKICKWLLNRKNLLKDGVIVFIGPGHNGGDGAVVARELFLKGFLVSVWCPFPIKKKITQQHLNYITSIGIKKLTNMPNPKKNDLWIDAILGNNQRKAISKEIINLFTKKFENNCGSVLSIDLPTGLCPNSGKPLLESAIKSHFTISIGLKKIGILQDSAIPYVGKIHNLNLGFTEKQLTFKENYLSISKNDIENISFSLPPKNLSKYERGRTLLISGSEKFLGANSLVIQGALASGVGSIKALLPESIVKQIWKTSPEIVVEGLLRTSSEKNSLMYEPLKRIDLNRFETVLVGPGIGIDIEDWEKSMEYFLNYKGILILDADVLSRITKSKFGCKFFSHRESKTWITPHFSEFKRLFSNITGINNIELARNAAKQFDLSILLKGAHSVVTDNYTSWQICKTDSDAARAGLGDLLSGFVSGMAALEMASGKNISTESFAKYVFLHSYAALTCVEGSTASAIGKQLSKVVRKIKMRQMS